jgi:hypothetical protein
MGFPPYTTCAWSLGGTAAASLSGKGPLNREIRVALTTTTGKRGMGTALLGRAFPQLVMQYGRTGR